MLDIQYDVPHAFRVEGLKGPLLQQPATALNSSSPTSEFSFDGASSLLSLVIKGDAAAAQLPLDGAASLQYVQVSIQQLWPP